MAASLEVAPMNLRGKRQGLANFWQRATQGETADESSNRIPHEVLLSKKSWRQMRAPQITVRPLARAPSVRSCKNLVVAGSPPTSIGSASSVIGSIDEDSASISSSPPNTRPCEVRMTSKKSWRQTIPSKIALRPHRSRSRSLSCDSRSSITSIPEDEAISTAQANARANAKATRANTKANATSTSSTSTPSSPATARPVGAAADKPLAPKKSWRPLARMASKKSFRSVRANLRPVSARIPGENNDRTNARHVEASLQSKPSWRQMYAAQLSMRSQPRTFFPSEPSEEPYTQTKPSMLVTPGENNDRTNSRHFESGMQSKRSWRQAYAPHISLRHVSSGGKSPSTDSRASLRSSTSTVSSSASEASMPLSVSMLGTSKSDKSSSSTSNSSTSNGFEIKRSSTYGDRRGSQRFMPKTRYIKKVEIPTLGSALNRVRNNEGDVSELDFGQLSAKNRKLESQGGVLVARVLITNRTVKRLVMRDHGIGDQGAIAIANMLRFNSSIEYIDLYGNEITDVGASAIADVLYGHDSVVHLSLWSNQITSKGATALAEAIKCNRKLKYLGLVHNRITQEGAQALLDALDVNFRLETLDLSKNRVPASLTSKIRVALARNRVEAPNLLSMMAIEEAEVERRLAELGLDDNRDEVTDAVSETTDDTSEVTDDDLTDDDSDGGDEVWTFSEDDDDLTGEIAPPPRPPPVVKPSPIEEMADGVWL